MKKIWLMNLILYSVSCYKKTNILVATLPCLPIPFPALSHQPNKMSTIEQEYEDRLKNYLQKLERFNHFAYVVKNSQPTEPVELFSIYYNSASGYHVVKCCDANTGYSDVPVYQSTSKELCNMWCEL